MQSQYNVVVIGAGSGGLTAAVGFAKVGKSVLLVEREHMGGECTNTGCIPSKALLHAAKQDMDATAAFSYVRNTIEKILAEETPETFQNMGIDVVMGEAVFSSKNSIEVGETTYTFKNAIIASGSSPRMIDIDGLDDKYVLTNQNIFDLPDVPKRLLIIGGGPIGMEMAQACVLLGSHVTIAEQGDQFGHKEDEAIRPVIAGALTQLGVTIYTNASITHADGNTAYLDQTYDTGTTETISVPFDKVLIAIGRTPNIPDGLKNAGIEATPDGVTVNQQYQTTNRRVYAVGDVSQRLKFTHTADDTARQVVARVISRGILKVNSQKAVPKVTYTTPEIAQVGMHHAEAEDTYGADRIMRIEVPFTNNDRAKTDDATNGTLIVIAKRINGRVLGAHIAGPAAGEIISVFTLAIDHKLSLWKLQKTIFPYPTYSLIIKKAADQFVGQQIADLTTDIRRTLTRHAPKAVAALIWITALVALNNYQSNSGLTVTQTSVQLFEVVTATAWGPLLYIILYAVRPITFFPATALTILSGVFFGLVWGIIYTLIAATLAATVAYTVGRFFGQGLNLERTYIGGFVTTLREHTFIGTLTGRLIFLPFDLMSYAAGILRVPFVPFVIATSIGIILGTATFVSIGAALDVEKIVENGLSTDVITVEFLIISALIFITSLGLARLIKRVT